MATALTGLVSLAAGLFGDECAHVLWVLCVADADGYVFFDTGPSARGCMALAPNIAISAASW